MGADRLVAQLDGLEIVKKTDGWDGFFEGTLTARSVASSGDARRAIVRLEFPTSKYDSHDLVWRDEIEAGFTSKVQLSNQDGTPLSQRVLSVERLGLNNPDVEDAYVVELEIVESTVSNRLVFRLVLGDQVLAEAVHSDSP